MSVVETLNGLERQVKLSLSLENIEKDVKAQLKRIQRTAKVQGFRPGRAPLNIIEQIHGGSVRYDVINNLANQALSEVVREQKINIAGVPSIELGEPLEGQVSLIAKFEVFPEVALPDLKALAVKRYTCDVTDEDIDQTIEIIRTQRAKYDVQADRVSEAGDRVTVDFVGKIDGVEFEGGKAENFPFILAAGQMLPEFDAAATGLKAGESKTFELHFPEDYHGKDVAGKTAEFTIVMKEVALRILPELTAEFVKSLGQKDGDVANFKKEVRANLERETSSRVDQRTKMEVLNQLADAAEVELPKALVEQEVQERMKFAREDLKARGLPNADTFELPVELFENEAKRRVKLGLLLRELVDSAKLQVKPEQVRAHIEQMSLSFEKPEEVVTYYLSDANRRQEVENFILEKNVVDHILSQAQVTDEKLGLKEVMGNA